MPRPKRDWRTLIEFDDNGCWLWTGGIDRNGYGRWRNGHETWAHRAVYLEVIGSLTPGLQLDHLCRVSRCVNLAHLEEVTSRENTLRGFHPSAVAFRSGRCKRGHDLGEHGAMSSSGGRYCKECRRQYQRARYREQIWPSMVAKRLHL